MSKRKTKKCECGTAIWPSCERCLKCHYKMMRARTPLCGTCGETRPEEFYARHRTKCKKCARARARRNGRIYYAANKAKCAKRMRKYYLENAEDFRVRARRFYWAHREEMREYYRAQSAKQRAARRKAG